MLNNLFLTSPIKNLKIAWEDRLEKETFVREWALIFNHLIFHYFMFNFSISGMERRKPPRSTIRFTKNAHTVYLPPWLFKENDAFQSPAK